MTGNFHDGLKAAANYLYSTAVDYEQIATRLSTNRSSPIEQEQFRLYEAQARLLRGQAGHILELPQPKKSRPF